MDEPKDSIGKAAYRMACGVSFPICTPPLKASVEYCQELTDRDVLRPALALQQQEQRNPRPYKVVNVVRSTHFCTRYAAADHFFTHWHFGSSSSSNEAGATGARVCLLGDAAHIHPPSGGQA